MNTLQQFKHKPIPAEAIKWDGTKKGVKALEKAGFKCQLDSSGFLRYYDQYFGAQYMRPGEWLVRSGKRIKSMTEENFSATYEVA